MRAIILERPGEFRMTDVKPPPKPTPDEATVVVRRIGICGSDFRAFQGKHPFLSYPRIIGHELGVEIELVGQNEMGLAVGDRCAVEPYLNCGSCIACRRGKANCCINLKLLGIHIDGGMCERLTVPISKLQKSQKLSLDQLAVTEMLSVGAHAVRRAAPEAGETVLVIGVGPIGLSVAEFARQAGASVMVMDINDRRVEFCRDVLKFTQCINRTNDPLAQLRDLLSGELPTVVFDCSGNPKSMENAFTYLAHTGKLVLVGIFRGDVSFYDPDFHSHETTILSSRNATAADFRQAIEFMEVGKINVTPWITHRVSSDDLIRVFPGWADGEGGVLKAVVDW